MKPSLFFLVASVAAQLDIGITNSLGAKLSPVHNISIGSPLTEIPFQIRLDATRLYVSPSLSSSGLVFNLLDLEAFSETSQCPFNGEDLYIPKKIGIDRISIGGFEVDDYPFVLSDIDGFRLGLALPGPVGYLDDCPNKNFSIVSLMQESGYIKSKAFSLSYFDSAPQVLFGAIDHGAYDGSLYKFKLLHDTPIAKLDYINPGLLLDGIAGFNFLYSNQSIALLSYGPTYLLQSYIDALTDHFNGTQGRNLVLVPCLYLQLTDYISFYFSGVEFPIPEKSFISPPDSSYPGCVLNVAPAITTMQLGDIFMKGRYVVVDYDSGDVALGQAASEEKQETIQEIVSGIPLATTAVFYTYSEWDSTSSDQYVTSYYTMMLKHPDYAMYTGKRSNSDVTVSLDTEAQTATTSALEPSSSSKASADHTFVAGGVMAFFVGALLMM